jgi:hypothetical protein
METQALTQIVNYNGFVGEVFSKMHILPSRSGAELRCTLSGGTEFLKQALEKLSENKTWLPSENLLLNEFKKLFLISSNHFIRINIRKAMDIFNLSVLAMSERVELIKNEMLDSENFRDFKEILFILEANLRLLKLINYKLEKSKIKEQDILNIMNISNSLVKSYLFINENGGIEKEDIRESLLNTKAIWRYYHSLSEIEDKWQIS